ncbi:WecB/TagA/CpsF family glycosyltransferase [Aquabacter sp. CN5-332]|uniref:WecB/TagA/CpsF family glycosyltransferase n=1 Tax=Aquabacter sp. CN5-332 TaxID=3156608 RepID=UPI0032B44924
MPTPQGGTDGTLPGRMHILGVRVDVIDLPRATSLLSRWAEEGGPHSVFVRDAPSLMLISRDEPLQRLHEHASLVVPDGTPLVWIGRLRGFGGEIGRVAGADLVDAVCAASLETGRTHFFYGGKPGVAGEMAHRLEARYPGLRVAGVHSPPMRAFDPAASFDTDGLAELDLIRKSGADFVWVGISSPKQEAWISRAAPRIGQGVFLGVGAAFDFHSGTIRRAPPWMRDHGLEWLHRLASEPGRLWRRYLLLAPQFLMAAAAEEMGRAIRRIRAKAPTGK